MRKTLFALVLTLVLALPAHAQQNQNTIIPAASFNGGVIVSNSTSPIAKLTAIATSSLAIASTDIVEGTKLFFTNARAIGATLTGYVSGAGTITAADTVLSAIQKLNGNIAAIVSSQWTTVSGGINYSGGKVGIGSSTPSAKLSILDQSGTDPTTTLLLSLASSSPTGLGTTTLFSVLGTGSTTISGALRVAGGSFTDNNGKVNLAVGISGVNKAKCGIAVLDNFAAGCAQQNGALIGANISNDTNYNGYSAGVFQKGSNVNAVNSAGSNSVLYVGQGNTATSTSAGIWSQTGTVNVNTNSTAYGFVSQNYLQGTGQLTNYIAYNSQGQYATAGPTVTNQYDFRADPFAALVNGTTTNRYGLYLGYDNTSITNAYGVYQLSPTVKNYFAGNVGFGSTSPTARVSIVGGVGSTTDLFVVASSSNTQYLTVTGAGSVGIGTTSPLAKVGLTGNGLTTGLAFQIANSSSVPSFNVTDNGTVTALTSFGNLGGSSSVAFPSGRLQLTSGGQSMWYLDNSVTGGVRTASTTVIGWSSTNAPSTAADTGLSRLSAAIIGVGNGTTGNATGTLVAGKIGIGTSTPQYPLVVVGTTTASCFSADNGATCITGTGATLTGTTGQVAYFSGTNTAAGTSTLFISPAGKIGIATTSPNSLLTIGGSLSTSATDGLNFGGDATANLYRSAAGMIRTDGGFTAGGGQFIVNATGSITSSPGATFSNIYLNGTNITTVPSGIIGFTPLNWYDAPDTAISRLGANKLAIGNGTAGDVSGTLIAAKIGIGTTTPAFPLVVIGTTTASCFSVDDGATCITGGGGSGTVTSVGLTVPTGLSVSGSPVTGAGTLAVSLAGGYNIPLTASTTNWNTAYDFVNAGHTNWDTAYTNRITSASLPLSIAANAISIAQANTSTNGYLSSTDWNTFNNKQAALTGTTGQLGYFSGTNTFTATSSLFLSPTGSLGIGTTTPGSALTVQGDITASGNIFGTLASMTNLYTGSSGSSAQNAYVGDVTYSGSVDNTVTTQGGGVRNRFSATNDSGHTVSRMSAVVGRTITGATGSPYGPSTTTDAINFYAFPATLHANDYVQNAYGLYVDGGAMPGATMDNHTGVYVADLGSGTNRYGFYQAGSTDNNYFAGNTGFGTTSPGSKLSVQGAALVNGSITGNSGVFSTTTTSSPGTILSITSNYTGASSVAVPGFTDTLTWSGTANNSVLSLGGGLRNSIVLNNASNGFNVARMTGLNIGVNVTGTNASTTDGSSFTSQAPTVSSGNLLTNRYAFWAQGATTPGTITNNYGLYVDDLVVGTNRYGVYQAGASDKNFFNGNVGIGTSTPLAKLDIYGAAGTGDIFAISSSSNSRLLTVTSSGNLGIGTSTPGAKMTIQGSSSGTILSLFSDTGTKFFEMLNTGVTTMLGTLDLSGATVKQHLYPTFTYATSTAWTTGTTTQTLGMAVVKETWQTLSCFTDAGTVALSVYDGTNRMNTVNVTTATSTVTLSTNNALVAGSKRYVDIGTPTGSPQKVSCTVDKIINQ